MHHPLGDRDAPQPLDAELLHRLRASPTRSSALAYAGFLRSIDRVVWRVLGADAERDDEDLIDLLPAKERVVFSLVVLEGHPLDAAALRLGYSRSTAKRRLVAARRRFELLLARHPGLFACLHEPGSETTAPGPLATRRRAR